METISVTYGAWSGWEEALSSKFVVLKCTLLNNYNYNYMKVGSSNS